MGLVDNCPGCKHSREVHQEGSCYRLVETVTAGGEGHLTLCGYCGWEATVYDGGGRGWRKVDRDPGQQDTAVVSVEAETLESALMEVSRIMGFR